MKQGRITVGIGGNGICKGPEAELDGRTRKESRGKAREMARAGLGGSLQDTIRSLTLS